MERRKGMTVNVKVEPRWGTPISPFALQFKDGTLRTADPGQMEPIDTELAQQQAQQSTFEMMAEQNPSLTYRELANQTGIPLGSLPRIARSLGWVKDKNGLWMQL